jgi:dihydroorotate dehydrogenase electron transfer subunit
VTPERKIITGIVKENSRIAAGIYEMVIEAEAFKNFIPGQFINVYLADKSMLLPRPISISEADDSSITLVYKVVGKGTGCLSGSRAGESIKISSPLGNGFDIKDDHTGKKIALVAGGIGIPPMIGLAGALKKRGTHVYAFLGFPSEVFLFEKLKAICDDVLIATDDGSAGFNGNAVELLEKSGALFDKYFACGPKAMLKSLCEYIAKVERDVQVSVEERMGCGYGACVGCSCKIREEGAVKRKSVCKDGPVFWGKDVVWGE